MRSLFSLLLLGLLAAGCASTGAAGSTPASVIGPTWRLVAFGDERPAVSSATLTFGSDGRVSGSTGCNHFFGQYTLAPSGALTLSGVGSTRMACPGPAMAQEGRFLAALNAATQVVVDGGRLTLVSADDALMTFEGPGRASAAISGTVRYRERIALPPDAVLAVQLLDVSLADAPSVTLAETVDETAGAQVPLPFSLPYDAGRIDPRHRYAVRAEIRDGDGALLWTTDTVHPVLTHGAPRAGVEVRVVQVTDDHAGGASGGDRSSALVGVTWRLAEITSASGVALGFDGTAPYTLTFNADGTASGQADCNRFGGPYAATPAGGLSFGPTAATLAACPEPSAAGDFFAVFNTVARYEIAGSRLTLRGATGLLVFTRG